MAEKRNSKPIAELGYKMAVVCLTSRQIRALGMDPEKVTTSDVRKYVWNVLGMDKLMEAQLEKERKERGDEPKKKAKKKAKKE